MWALAWVAVCASARFAPAAFSNSSRRLGKKVDTYEAWVERWRSEGSERCRAPKESREADVCEWLREAGPAPAREAAAARLRSERVKWLVRTRTS